MTSSDSKPLQTRRYAEVIGDPVAHSLSPAIHRFWLARLGIAARFDATRVEADALGEHLRQRAADPGWRGCSVTAPHKQAVLTAVDRVDPLAHRIGAANALYRDGTALVAANTDVAGFLAPIGAQTLAGATVAVIGAGGAARAVVHALESRKVGSLHVFNRHPARAMTLLDTLGVKGTVASLPAVLPAVDLLVNASPLGMAGQPRFEPDLSALPGHALVYDLVYAPRRTPLLTKAAARGLRTCDGLAMLVAQATEAFALFFGTPAPRCDDAALFESLGG